MLPSCIGGNLLFDALSFLNTGAGAPKWPILMERIHKLLVKFIGFGRLWMSYRVVLCPWSDDTIHVDLLQSFNIHQRCRSLNGTGFVVCALSILDIFEACRFLALGLSCRAGCFALPELRRVLTPSSTIPDVSDRLFVDAIHFGKRRGAVPCGGASALVQHLEVVDFSYFRLRQYRSRPTHLSSLWCSKGVIVDVVDPWCENHAWRISWQALRSQGTNRKAEVIVWSIYTLGWNGHYDFLSTVGVESDSP